MVPQSTHLDLILRSLFVHLSLQPHQPQVLSPRITSLMLLVFFMLVLVLVLVLTSSSSSCPCSCPCCCSSSFHHHLCCSCSSGFSGSLCVLKRTLVNLQLHLLYHLTSFYLIPSYFFPTAHLVSFHAIKSIELRSAGEMKWESRMVYGIIDSDLLAALIWIIVGSFFGEDKKISEVSKGK